MVLAVAGMIALMPLLTKLKSYRPVVQPGKELVKQVETDSLRYELYLLEDEKGFAQAYMAEVFTPVCHTNECYPVYINFFWDLLGNYERYEIPEGELLTKLDHVPFDKADHKKLQTILSNDNALLKDYKIEELVGSTTNVSANGVDAVTGATLKTIQNDVISGAVYSCYTLWHLARGEMAATARAYTAQNSSEGQLLRFLESGHYPYQYWAIEKVLEGNFQEDKIIIEAMLQILRGDNIFLASHLIEVLPADVFSGLNRQIFLWETMEKSQYRLQMDIMDKFNALALYPDLQKNLLEALDTANPAQQRKILSVLQNQSNLPKPHQFQALGYIQAGKWVPEITEILDKQNNLDKTVKKQLDIIKTQHK